ncbi:hypothetical protein STEG23_038338, partial [Scotinomys teguina]
SAVVQLGQNSILLLPGRRKALSIWKVPHFIFIHLVLQWQQFQAANLINPCQ